MAWASCEHPHVVLRYVALGDSYTIGTSVGQAERWPNQLAQRLVGGPCELVVVGNLALNGYATADVIDDELPRLRNLAPEFLSLLIGVNDVVRGIPAARYRANAAAILDGLLGLLPANRIMTVGTPDYTVTPSGAAFGDPSRQAAAIAANNRILEALAGERGIAFVDIIDLSRQAAGNRALVADDGLHPSGAQYALWVDRIEGVVRKLLAA